MSEPALKEVKKPITSIDHKSRKCIKVISNIIYETLTMTDKKYDRVVIFCIGTDRHIADAIGPLTGTFLKGKKLEFIVMGDLDNPIHAINIKKHLKDITPTDFVIAVDACLGVENYIGNITIKPDSIQPGCGVGKKLPSIGDLSILGIVGDAKDDTIFTFQSTRLNTIYSMSQVIAKSIIKASDMIKKSKKS